MRDSAKVIKAVSNMFLWYVVTAAVLGIACMRSGKLKEWSQWKVMSE